MGVQILPFHLNAIDKNGHPVVEVGPQTHTTIRTFVIDGKCLSKIKYRVVRRAVSRPPDELRVVKVVTKTEGRIA
ncbi:MAG: hypothetical protein KKG00_02835, partial [Bacteroidetes bacterium]|nr:hypothetical protein [Bacteroidota bacterium]